MSTATSAPAIATFRTAFPVTKSRPVLGSIRALRRAWTSASAIGMARVRAVGPAARGDRRFYPIRRDALTERKVARRRFARIDRFPLTAARSSMPAAPRTLFVTTALPYANGPFHIGHVMEYIQADIWVRFQ